MKETEKDRQQDLDGFLHPAQIEHDQGDAERHFGRELVGLSARWQQAEWGVHASGDGDGDGEGCNPPARPSRISVRLEPSNWVATLQPPPPLGKQPMTFVRQGDDEYGQEAAAASTGRNGWY